MCRFEAVFPGPDAYRIDPLACEGCASCVYQCPEEAIHSEEQQAGLWFRSDTRFGPLLHAHLFAAQENSGKLVTIVKQQARLLALDHGRDLLIVDGPPGIGCPVISASAGADLALLVTEPTMSGVHDLERILGTVSHFRVPALVLINKVDVNPVQALIIEAYCEENGIHLVGKLPYDDDVTRALVHGQPVTCYAPEGRMAEALAAMWTQVRAHLNGTSKRGSAGMELEQAIVKELQKVIDPETGVDVMRMRLIEELQVDEETGRVRYQFRPSSPLCPLAVHLALNIREAVAQVSGVTEQEIQVVGYVGAEELNALLKETAKRARLS